MRRTTLAVRLRRPSVALARSGRPRRRSTSTPPPSLTNVFPALDKGPTYSFGGSNTLQLQIERGAPADVFASASPTEAQALFREGRCTRPVTFAINRLVLLIPNSNPGDITSVYSLRSGGRKLSIGTAGVPIGAYTRQLLQAHAPVVDPELQHASASRRTWARSPRRSRWAPPTPASSTTPTALARRGPHAR